MSNLRSGTRKPLIVVVSFLLVLLTLGGCLCSLLAGTTVLAMQATGPGMGAPVVVGSWEVTVDAAHQETSLQDFANAVYTPNADFTFLVVDATLRNLDSAQATKVPSDAFVLIDAAGQPVASAGLGDSQSDRFAFGSYSISNDTSLVLKNVAIAFVVPQSQLGRGLTLRFQSGPRIALRVSPK